MKQIITFKINDFSHLATVWILIINEWIADLNLFIYFFNLKSVTFHYLIILFNLQLVNSN